MIKKIVLFSFVCFSLSATPPHVTSTRLVTQAFGKMDLSLVSFHFLEDLFYRIALSTPYEKQCACKKAATVLSHEIEKREHSLTTVDTETKQRIEHNIAILTIQKDHYERVARLLKKEITPYYKIIGWIKNVAAYSLSLLLSPFKKYAPPIQQLANDLVIYTKIEREEIFINHKKTLQLLISQNNHNIPLIIRFWDYPRHRHRLLNEVKRFQGQAQPQAAIAADILEAGSELLAQGAEKVGVVLGDKAATATLEAEGDAFENLLEEFAEMDVETLVAGAAQAGPEIVEGVMEVLTPAVENVATVVDSEITLGEALQVTEAVLEESAETATQVTSEATQQAAAQTGQQATETAATQATAGTGEQTLDFTVNAATSTTKASVNDLKAAVEAAQKAVDQAAASAEKAAQEATQANKLADQAAQAAEKATQDATQAAEDAKKATATAAEKKAAAAANPTPENIAASQAADEAETIAKQNAAALKLAASNAQTNAQLTAEMAAQKTAAAQAAHEAHLAAQSTLAQAQSVLQRALVEAAAEQAAQEGAKQTTTAAAQKAAAQAAKKAAIKAAKDAAKAAKAAEKTAAAAEKAAAQAAKKAEQAAAAAKKAADAAEAATAKTARLEKIAKEKIELAKNDPTPNNVAAANKATNALNKAKVAQITAKQAAQTAKETSEEAAQDAQEALEKAKPLRIAADEAKAAAKAAAEKAFGVTKTWATSAKEFIEMMGNMLLQMEIAMGTQMVAAWQSAADALVFASLSQQRTLLMTKLNHFFSQLAIQQQKALSQINANFSAQIAVIASQLCLQITSNGLVVMSGLLPTLFAVEQSFVTQALVTATVKSVFLLNPMSDDQLFYDAPMAAQKIIFSHTPFSSNGLSTSWYNPYRSGNWQFCSADYSGVTQGSVTSFVQYTAQPFTSSTYPQGDPVFAVQNSIFTEYIPPATYNKQSVESYTISVACTLLSEPYQPFIMGIMFNGARWISGVLDLHHQHRLFCIYSLPGQKAGPYNVGFAETFYQNQGQMNLTQDQLSDQNIAGLNAIWPAYQLLSPQIQTLSKMATGVTVTPIANPLATIPALPVGTPYIFTIETQPNQVTLTISTPDGKILYPAGETAASLQNSLSLPNQIQNLNGLIFLYHNIGFMAPGCSAQFCLKQPADLCFAESQIKTIEASLNKGMS
jgi:hypothetical protein